MWTKLTEYAEGIAEIVAPPDGAAQYEDAHGAADSAAAAGVGLATAAVIDEDEQEQYISELERALLQRKKANDTLEQRIRELEESHALEKQRFKLQLQQQENVIAGQKTQLQIQKREHEGAIAALRMAMLQPKSQQDTSAAKDRSSSSTEQSSHFAGLMQAASILSSLTPSERSQIPKTDESAVMQLLALSQEVVTTMDITRKRLSVLQNSMASFLTLHDKEFDVAELSLSSPKEFSQSFSSALQAKLASISDSLLKAASTSKELERIQQKLKALEAKDEEQSKKAMHLQAQVNSMQAIQKNTERTLQHTASSKEAELLAVIDEKQALITRLQASTTQLKGSMEHLAVELESAQAEIDDLDSLRRAQLTELEALRLQVHEAENRQASFESLQNDEREIRARAGEYEQGYMQLLDEMEKLKAQFEVDKANLAANAEVHAFSADNQTIYELESRLAASEADCKVAVQDAERFQRDLENLEIVMHQFQTESKQQQAHVVELEAALEQSRKMQLQSQEKNANAVPEEDMKRVIAVLNKKTQECEQLREALEHSATRYSSESDVLDKSLAAQLVVSFCESDKKGEILQLISRMMGFSEEQKRRVGLGSSPADGYGGGGLFSSVLGLVAPIVTPPEGAQPIEVEGKNFTDIWAEFLLKEAKR